jgi:ferredoxin-thioredoxin reductase catalytic subunit/rhodanese-related sulfurtransferase
MIKIDIDSKEFKLELEKTKKFTSQVCENYNFVYNPNSDINDGIEIGLTRNKLIYNIRYCPCFMVEGDTKEKRKQLNNRICPCEPALKNEIPNEGKCHCGIFCTPQYAKVNALDEEAQVVVHSHSRGLTKEECKAILMHDQLDNDEIIALLEARDIGMVDFVLVDVREWMEWHQKRIVGTDILIPTTSFYNQLEQLENKKQEHIILYCFTGSRSAYCQRVMQDMGWKYISNFTYGIISYTGKSISGE